MVSQRGLDVLRAIVQDYVESREPVGSKSIVDRHNFGVSPATIRNEMALLEEENLIVAPHTSSGRVPTDKGYRIFVDHLAETRSISGAQRQAIERFLDESHDYDDLLQRTSRLLSQLTRQVAVVEYPSLGGAKVQRIELVNISNERLLCILIADNGRIDQRMIECGRDVSEGELNELSLRANGFVDGRSLSEAQGALNGFSSNFPLDSQAVATGIAVAITDMVAANRTQKLAVSGAANLVRTEEDFSGNLFPVLDAIEEQVVLLKLMCELALDTDEIAVSIGSEHGEIGLRAASLMAGSYSSGGENAMVGILGPTRMDYSANMAAVRAVSRYLSKLLHS
jgi:heat-inducible transcriptional repressor